MSTPKTTTNKKEEKNLFFLDNMMFAGEDEKAAMAELIKEATEETLARARKEYLVEKNFDWLEKANFAPRKEVIAAAKKPVAKVDPNKPMTEFEKMTVELRVYEEALGITNESLFTKQSKQFKEFRKAVTYLNEQLANCNDGVVKGENAKKLAEAIIAVQGAKLMYDKHCQKHPQSDVTRGQRVALVKDIMGFVKTLENIPGVFEEMNKVKAAAAKAGAANEAPSVNEVNPEVENMVNPISPSING